MFNHVYAILTVVYVFYSCHAIKIFSCLARKACRLFKALTKPFIYAENNVNQIYKISMLPRSRTPCWNDYCIKYKGPLCVSPLRSMRQQFHYTNIGVSKYQHRIHSYQVLSIGSLYVNHIIPSVGFG